MKAFNYTQKGNMSDLAAPQQHFTAKMIIKEVQKIAKEQNISEEDAYWAYTHGLYGADREMKNE
ncbi:MAG: hypothetical protein PHY47_09565 [Lachnospiraceae bacterium]|nr:hypothetical protein [Lachnospiraceae bacterium]